MDHHYGRYLLHWSLRFVQRLQILCVGLNDTFHSGKCIYIQSWVPFHAQRPKLHAVPGNDWAVHVHLGLCHHTSRYSFIQRRVWTPAALHCLHHHLRAYASHGRSVSIPATPFLHLRALADLNYLCERSAQNIHTVQIGRFIAGAAGSTGSTMVSPSSSVEVPERMLIYSLS